MHSLWLENLLMVFHSQLFDPSTYHLLQANYFSMLFDVSFDQIVLFLFSSLIHDCVILVFGQKLALMFHGQLAVQINHINLSRT